MFNNKSQEVQDKLLNYDIFKITKIRHPERYEKFLNHFKERVKRFAHKDYVKRRETKEVPTFNDKAPRTERKPPNTGQALEVPESQENKARLSSRRQQIELEMKMEIDEADSKAIAEVSPNNN